jgi:hypothetical protein
VIPKFIQYNGRKVKQLAPQMAFVEYEQIRNRTAVVSEMDNPVARIDLRG